MREFNKLFVTSLPRCATVSVSQALAQLGLPIVHLGKRYVADKVPPPNAATTSLATVESTKSSETDDSQRHYDPLAFIDLFRQLADDDYDLRCLQKARGIADYPACCPQRLKRLDQQYPGSLFIHVARHRNVEAWLQSIEKHFIGLDLLDQAIRDPVHREFRAAMQHFRYETFGSVVFDTKLYRNAYDSYHVQINRWSADAPQRWLVFDDIGDLASQGIPRLVEFLQLPREPWHEAWSFPHSDAHSGAAKAAFHAAAPSELKKHRRQMN